MAMQTKNGAPKPEVRAKGINPRTSVFSASSDTEPRELNADFWEMLRWQTIRTMMTDARVYAVHQQRRMPLLQARWFLSPSPEESEVSAMVHRALFQRLNFRRVIKHLTLYQRYGFMVLERLHGVDTDGSIYWRDWSPRMPWTIPIEDDDNERGFILDDEGSLIGIRQRAIGESDPQMMPRDRICLLVHEGVGNDHVGTPLVRMMRKNYKLKDGLERVDAVASERNAKNLPVINLPEETRPNDLADGLKIIAGLATNDRPGAVLPHNWRMQLLGTIGAVKDILNSIVYHGQQMADVSLANAMDIGRSQTMASGAYNSVIDVFQLQTIGDSIDICDEVQVAIEQLCQWNVSPNIEPKDVPTLMCETVAHRDFEKYTKSVALARKHGLLHWTPYDEQAYREEGRLPAIPENMFERLVKMLEEGAFDGTQQAQDGGADPGDSTDGTGDGENEGGDGSGAGVGDA